MRRLIYGCAIVLLFSIGEAARAEGEHGGTEVVATLKAWVNEWKRDVPGSGSSRSDTVALIGPKVEVEFRNGPVIEASYLMSLSDYTFTGTGTASEIDRKDLELAVGKWLDRYAGFFVGYRNASFEEKGAGGRESSYGLTYGLRGAVPLTETTGLYGNLTWLDTRFKAEGQAREDAPGWIVEAGGKTAFTRQFAMRLGYKWETTKSKDSQTRDTFAGLTLDLDYTF